LAPNEEDIVAETLAELGELVRKYKLQVFPYFKDYDRVSIGILKEDFIFDNCLKHFVCILFSRALLTQET
jgi:hypothetical protein